MSRRNIGDRGLAVVAHYEGERNPKCGWRAAEQKYYPYKDPGGIWTIGLGTIAYPDGRKVGPRDQPINEMEANYLMNWELDEKEDAVVKMCQKTNLKLLDCEFDAIVSMSYNCGVGILESGSSFRTALLSGNKLKIEKVMLLYVKVTKKVLGIPIKVTMPGLVARRKTEFNLFANGDVKFFN